MADSKYKIRGMIILHGPIDSGKTTTLHKIIRLLKMSNIHTAGSLQKKVFINDESIGYDACLIPGHITFPLARLNYHPGWCKFGKYYFSDEAFAKCAGHLEERRSAKVIIIDEIGPFELEGGGHYKFLHDILINSEFILVVTCRDEILDSVVRLFDSLQIKIYTFDIKKNSDQPACICDFILNLL